MKALEIPVFFLLYAIGNLPEPWIGRSLPLRLLLNLGGKIALAGFFILSKSTLAGPSSIALNGAMALAIASAMPADNYRRFFERVDLAQSAFLVDVCAVGMPMADGLKFLCAVLIPHLLSNAILLSIGFSRNGGATNVENFHNLFGRDKILATAASVAMAFSMGIPPFGGDVWRSELVTHLCGGGRMGQFAAFAICLYAIGYAYLRWMAAMFVRKNPPRADGVGAISPWIKSLVAACALGIIACVIFHATLC
jgi:NADH:ubiquinone oxidoreductase subunit 2 (subunit N)